MHLGLGWEETYLHSENTDFSFLYQLDNEVKLVEIIN
jgi:hypothetical protein